jgi:hypothetical protein
MEMLEAIMKWIVAPVTAFVFLMYRTQQNHQTDIAVLRAEAAANKEAHDREFREVRRNFETLFTKLDSIEGALRK